MAARLLRHQSEQIANALAVVRSLDGDHSHIITLLQAQLADFPSLPENKATPQTESQVFRFVDLPPELRNVIYELCLAKGKVFLRPRPTYDQRYEGYEHFDRPDWQLLSVSRQVRTEAVAVLTSHNHFVISYEHDGWEPFLGPNGHHAKIPMACKQVALATHVRKHLNSVSITFELRNMVGDAVRLARYGRSLSDSEDGEASVLHTHERIGDLCGQWWQLAKRAACPNLRFLQVNIANCLCPIGCHRLIHEAANAIRETSFGRRLEVIEILGTVSSSERTAFIRALFRYEEELYENGYFLRIFENCRPIVGFRNYRTEEDEPSSFANDRGEPLEDEDVNLGPLIDEHKRKLRRERNSRGCLARLFVSETDNETDNEDNDDSEVGEEDDG
ncbi:hypothetical protein LTR36_004659 [Oleoguttula mirabilis]|uniref:Uncharacterized protein n=1 Tax=Oleoguttula mirabilis TaxID=1507867 RepID=A0AAV9JFA4_9PEZI|nr:hypothetical protein LTR36_004659 [Oleoguttula mirabilis]